MPDHLANPTSWIEAQRRDRPPMVYVAHPVAARPGECIARCMRCHARHAFGAGDALDLRRLCNCDTPVTHTSNPGEIVAFNLERALRWWKWLEQLTGAVWTMPWYVNVTANGEADPVKIKRGLRDDCEIVKRCDALMLCGPRVSSGMRLEALTAIEAGLPVFQIGAPIASSGEPPPHDVASVPWSVWQP